jgi:hypothetical protein
MAGNPIGREAIWSAFFAQLQGILLSANGAAQAGKTVPSPPGPMNYMGRRPVPDTQMAEEQYPAAFLIEVGETYDRSRLFAPAKVSLLGNLTVLSAHGEVPDETNVTDLNNLADAVESAIQSACGPTVQNTLGGLVQQAWINHRQLVITGAYPQRLSKQTFLVELVLPHSR